MDLIVEYQWEIFIFLEVLSFISILLFGTIRYLFNKQKFSLTFLFLFIGLLFLEAALAFLIYMETGEISNFQIIITVFVLYACTFGINDFKKLDRWMRMKIGNWKGVELLTDKDKQVMRKQKDPKHIAKKYRYSSIIHLVLFIGVQLIFWIHSLDSLNQAISYVNDLSWIGSESVDETPYANETIYEVSMVWGVIFVVDFIYSWSYTIFPPQQKDDEKRF